jgi:hypothetical protein
VPAGVHLALLFLLDVVQPVFFVQEKLAAARAPCHVVPVRIPGVDDELVIACKFLVAILAFALVVEKAHGGLQKAYAKRMTEKEKVATPCFYLLRLTPDIIAYTRPTPSPNANGIHTGNAAASNTCLTRASNMPEGYFYKYIRFTKSTLLSASGHTLNYPDAG